MLAFTQRRAWSPVQDP
uniref:Uncharacterized protein n=1 Tax=Anguilla anguilla TaxID=7936 RepID=A0A0E9U2G1_ANGAN